MTLLFFILSPTPDMGRRGLVIDFNFIVYKKKWHVPSHLSYIFHACINANGMRFLYIWRSIDYTLHMYHPSNKMEHNILCLFSIPYVFWTRQQNNNKGESWKTQQHRIRKGPTVYTDKTDICFSQCKFFFVSHKRCHQWPHEIIFGWSSFFLMSPFI